MITLNHPDKCCNGRTRRDVVNRAGGSRRVLVAYDDLAGGPVVLSEVPGAAPTYALATTGDTGETSRALLCRAMAAELRDALDRALAQPADAVDACDASRDPHDGTQRLQLAATLRAIADNDQVYDARYPLVWRALALATGLGYRAGVALDPAQPDWPVVYLELPHVGQVSWHMPAHRQPWDGHTTGEKLDRVDAYVRIVDAGVVPELLAA